MLWSYSPQNHGYCAIDEALEVYSKWKEDALAGSMADGVLRWQQAQETLVSTT
jgi:hypothetical protein